MESKGDYIRRKCLERLNTNSNLGVLEFQDGIYVGMEYNEKKYNEDDMKYAYEQGARLALISVSPLALHKGSFPTPTEWIEQFKK